MQKEIETRFLEIDKAELVDKLLALGAVDKGEGKLDEIIFYPANGSWEGKRKFIRLRTDGKKTTLTYKTNEKQEIDSAREINLEVSDFDKCAEFMQCAEMVINRQNEKKRHTFELGEVTVDIDTWPKIPAYAELEGPSIESLKDVCEKLGLNWGQRFDADAAGVMKQSGYDIFKLKKVTFTEFE